MSAVYTATGNLLGSTSSTLTQKVKQPLTITRRAALVATQRIVLRRQLHQLGTVQLALQLARHNKQLGIAAPRQQHAKNGHQFRQLRLAAHSRNQRLVARPRQLQVIPVSLLSQFA